MGSRLENRTIADAVDLGQCSLDPLAVILPLTAGETALNIMGGVFVLAMECINTAIERVVDDISTQRRDRAGQAKDAGSAAVAVSAVGVGMAWLVILFRLVTTG